MTASAVDEFFQICAAAFSRRDVDAVGRLWAYPAYMVVRGKRAALSEPEFRTNTIGLFAFYKRQGVAEARKRVLELTPSTARTATFRTADQILDGDGRPIIAWEHVYVLNETTDGLKVVAVFPDEELDAWNASGTPMGPWRRQPPCPRKRRV